MGYDLRTLSDIAEIRRLNARYNKVADNADAPAYAALFTEDGVFELIGSAPVCGRIALEAMALATTATIHVATEPDIEVDGDSARQQVRMLILGARRDKSWNRLVTSGWYHDVLARMPDGWRYRHRRVELDLDLPIVRSEMMHARS